MPSAAAWGEETREEGEMGLDLLLGLGLLPPAMAAPGGHGHGGGSAAHQQQQRRRRPYGKTGFVDDERGLSFAGAATETASAMRRRLPVARVADGDGDVYVVPAAPPASMLNPASSTAARWPAHANTLPWPRQRASPLMQRSGGAARGLFLGNRRLVAAGLIAAAARSNHDDSTAPVAMIYAGSMHAYAGVTMEHAEKILAMVAKEAQAAGIGILPVQEAEPQLELVAAHAPVPTGGAAQMTMHWGLAHDHVNDCLKRTASLARFLNKRKQRTEISAPTILHHPPRREEWLPAQPQIMDDAPAPAAMVSTRTSASLGAMDRQPWASQGHPKRMKANHPEEAEAVSTELRI